MQSRLISRALIGKAWPLIEPWIASALEAGLSDNTPADIRPFLEDGRMQLWLAWDEERRIAKGCCITELIGGARGRHCNVVIVAGAEFDAWETLVADIETWAIGHGCNRLEMNGRPGWERKLARRGWKKIRTTLEKALGDVRDQAEAKDGRGAVGSGAAAADAEPTGAETGLRAVPEQSTHSPGATVH